VLEYWNGGVLGFTSINPLFHYSITPVLRSAKIIRLIELHPILLARPFLDESLGFRVDLESLLDGFFQAITTQ
jgi:hypothetical protein